MAGPPDTNNNPTWLIYDPVRHRYFQISARAFKLIAIAQSASEAAFSEKVQNELGQKVEPAELEELAAFLRNNHLTVEPQGNNPLAYVSDTLRRQHVWWQNIIHHYLFFKVPLFRPERFLVTTYPYVAPLFTRTAFCIVAATTLLGIYLASRQWEVFVSTFIDFLSPEGIALYAVCLVLLKSLHELGHAYAATRAGVRVNTMGVGFMLLMPILYTDVTDAWRLKSRSSKLSIDAAGMSVELAIAGIATFLWAFLPDGPARSVAFVLATTSWIVSLAVNLNPFMRFDGYYLLSDMWGIPNLQPRANSVARWWLREVLFDLGEPPPESLDRRTRNLLIAYAFGTWIYRLVLFIGIALLVYHIFFKALGIVLFIIEIAWFIVLPICNEVSEWWKRRDRIMQRSRGIRVAALAAAFVLIALVPWSGNVRLPAVAMAERETRLFSPRPARVERIAFRDGQSVAEGDAIAILSSPQLEFEINRSETHIALTKTRLDRIAGDRTDLSQRAVLESELATHIEKRAGLHAEQNRLTIVAPFSGVARDADLDLHPGQWLDNATPILRIVAESRSEVQGYVHEDDLWRIEVGQPAVFIPEDPLLARRHGRLIEIAQTGIETIDLPYLSSVFGGAIQSDRNSKGEVRPRAGRYLVRMEMDGPPPGRAARGTMHVAGRSESIAATVWRRVLQVLVRESGI